MKRTKIFPAVGAALCSVLVLCGTADAADGPYRVVVHRDNALSEISSKDLGSIYLGVKLFWDSGERVVPVLPDESSETTRNFVENVLDRSLEQYHSYWRRRLYSGGGTVPKTFRNSGDLVEFVRRTPGAIGIVEGSDQYEDLKVIELKP